MRINVIFLLFFLFSCSEEYTPKPRGFFKLELPNKNYQTFNEDCPFTFQYPSYSMLKKDHNTLLTNNCYMNIDFLALQGTLFVTYLPVSDNLREHIDQSMDLAYKHDLKADAISEQIFVNHEKKVYALLYDYEGVTATAIQFYITDSSSHFFRGSFYFNTEITDSILPLNLFIKEDVKYLIESFNWKNI